MVVGASLIFNGCEKDSENLLSDTFDKKLEYRVDSINSSDPILNNVNFDQDGNIVVGTDSNQVIIQHADIEYQREASLYIYQNASSNEIKDMRDNYGVPKWELSIINTFTDNENAFVITIPLFEDNELTSIIIYIRNNDYQYSYFVSKTRIEEIITQSWESLPNYKEWTLSVLKFQLMEFIITGSGNSNYNAWLNNDVSSNNTISYRSVDCLYAEPTDWYVNGEYVGTSYTFSIEPCQGGGTNIFSGIPIWTFGSNGNFNGGGSVGGSSTGGGKGGSKDDKLKKLDCNGKIKDFMALDAIQQMIANNTVTDPCDPTKSTEDILDEVLSALCGGAEIVNLSGPNSVKNDIVNSIDCQTGVDEQGITWCELLLAANPITGQCVGPLILNRNKTITKADEYFGANTGGGLNGCGDAFRHAYFNALNSKWCGKEIANLWGLAHECDSPDNSEKTMDLYNDEIGQIIGDGITLLSDDELADVICRKLKQGHLQILKDPNDPNSEIISSDGCECN